MTNKIIPHQQYFDAQRVSTIPDDLAIATGRISGIEILDKFGYNLDVDSGSVPEDLWGGNGAYTGFPTGAADTIDVVSASTSDTLTGSGAEVVRVSGLDADFNPQTEDIELSGDTAKTSVNTWKRVFRAAVIQSNNGANDAFNAGIITIDYTNDANVVFAIIPAGSNQTVFCGYTVPANTRLVVDRIAVELARSASATIQGAIWVRDFEKAPRLTQNFTAGQASNYLNEGTLIYQAKTDLAVRVTQASTTNVEVTGQISGYLVKDDTL